MGSFSNGIHGDVYEEMYCQRCVHEDEENIRPVFTYHLMCNREPEHEPYLEMFIPTKDCHNEQCTMFIEKELA